jgi:peptidoglycan/LPS O-acetylase OafA/YrhL
MTDLAPTKEPARRSATGNERIAALDGVRAVALLIIMAYHFGVGWFGGGFFSLDIFYVLSGYLITGLLLSEYRRRGGIRLSAFWLRRARRLLPALLVVLVVVTLFVRFEEPTGLYPDFRMDALSALFYFSNWWQIHASGNYFEATGAVSPLTHTWSLSVEEQFYLVWPLMVLAVLRLTRTFASAVRALLIVSVVGAAASAAEMAILYGPDVNVTRLYFGTDTHAQSLLIGAAMACVLTMVQMRRGETGMAPVARSRWAGRLLVAVGAAGFAGTLSLTYLENGTSSFDYRGGFALSALSAAAVIVGAVCVPRGPIALGLSIRPLVWLGTISYGAYLWHYPVFVYLDAERTGVAGISLVAIRFAATIAVATASFYLVERPVMEGTFWRSIKAAVPAAGLVVVTVAVVMAGTATTAAAGVPISQPRRLMSTSAGPTTTVLITGDSTALTLGDPLMNYADQSRDGLNVIDQGIVGCGVAEGSFFESDGSQTPMPPLCNPSAPASQQWPAVLKRWIRQFRPRVVVLLAGRWEVYDRTDLAGNVTNITHPAYARYVKEELQRYVSIVASAGIRTVLMTAPYYDSGEQPNGQPEPQDSPTRVRDYNRLVDEVAASNPFTTTMFNLNALVCPDGRFTSTVDGVLVRAPDGVHFPYWHWTTGPGPNSPAQIQAFSRWISPRVLPALAAAAH